MAAPGIMSQGDNEVAANEAASNEGTDRQTRMLLSHYQIISVSLSEKPRGTNIMHICMYCMLANVKRYLMYASIYSKVYLSDRNNQRAEVRWRAL